MNRTKPLLRTRFERKPEHTVLRRRRSLLQIGKKGRANKKANASLAKNYKGEQYCQAKFPHDCTGREFLTWAHNAKRRKNPDLLHAALICRNAHDAIEYLPPDEMMRIVDEIVERQELAA